MAASSPEALSFPDDGTAFPNSSLPALVYHDVAEAADAAGAEQLFGAHGWRGSWRNGIFSYHHFHSTAHEVLAIVAGTAEIMLGGPQGQAMNVAPRDVLVLPAGTGHRNLRSSGDLLVVGAYPGGMAWDVRRGDPAEYAEVKANRAAVPLPEADPVGGAEGPLVALWRAAQ